jgi:hypothetical protein
MHYQPFRNYNLYSTRTMGATVLSQEEKNLGEGSEGSINVIMTLNDS